MLVDEIKEQEKKYNINIKKIFPEAISSPTLIRRTGLFGSCWWIPHSIYQVDQDQTFGTHLQTTCVVSLYAAVTSSDAF